VLSKEVEGAAAGATVSTVVGIAAVGSEGVDACHDVHENEREMTTLLRDELMGRPDVDDLFQGAELAPRNCELCDEDWNTSAYELMISVEVMEGQHSLLPLDERLQTTVGTSRELVCTYEREADEEKKGTRSTGVAAARLVLTHPTARAATRERSILFLRRYWTFGAVDLDDGTRCQGKLVRDMVRLGRVAKNPKIERT
jgi:hypothetical protein